MNTTPFVGCIALLMIIASSIGGQNNPGFLKASALESSQASEVRMKTPDFLAVRSLSSRESTMSSRHIQIVIDGQTYSGTVFVDAGMPR